MSFGLKGKARGSELSDQSDHLWKRVHVFVRRQAYAPHAVPVRPNLLLVV